MMSKLDRLMMLQEEVKIAKKFVEEQVPRRYGLCKYCNQLYERKNS